MRQRAIPFLAFLLLLLALTACGASEVSTATSTGSSNSSTSSAKSGEASSGDVSSTPQEVRVVMGEMYFKPSLTTFKVGQAYKFVIVNEGKEPHEFTIAPPRKAGQNEKDEDKASLLDADQIAGGQSRTLNAFTFKQPAPAGTLEFECSYPNHYEMGMHTPIVVEP